MGSGGTGGGGGLSGAIGAIGSLLGGSQEASAQTKVSAPGIPEVDPVKATEGVPMWRFAGRRVRVPGTVIYVSKIDEDTVVIDSKAAGKDDAGATTKEYFVDIAIAFGQSFEGVNGSGKIDSFKKLEANGKNVWVSVEPDDNEDRYNEIRFYEGGGTQNPSPLLEEIFEEGKVPGFRDTAIVVIKELALADWGNAVPQVWEAIIQPDTHQLGSRYTVDKLLQAIWARVPDRFPWEIDVSQVTGSNTVRDGDSDFITADGQVEGFMIQGPANPADMIQAVVTTYDLGVRNENGTLVFYDRGTEPIVEVQESDIVVTDTAANPIRLRRLTHKKLPTEFVLQYYSKEQGFGRDSERVPVNSASFEGENIVTTTVPFVLPRKAAKRITRRRQYELRSQRMYCDGVTLPPTYMAIKEGYYLALPYRGEDGFEARLYVRAAQVTVGFDFRVQVEGPVVTQRALDAEILTSVPLDLIGGDQDIESEDGDDVALDPDPNSEDGEDGDYSPPLMEVFAGNVPPLTGHAAQNVGIYYGQATKDPDAVFKTTNVYASFKETGPYSLILSKKFKRRMPIGFLIAPFPGSSAADRNGIDRVSQLDVQMQYGIPLTITDDELLLGDKNVMLVGGEVIAFRDAEALPIITSPPSTSGVSIQMGVNLIARAPGNWINDGFSVGQHVRITGFLNTENMDIYRRITSISALIIEFDGPATVSELEPSVGAVSVVANVNAFRLTHLVRGLRDTASEAYAHDHEAEGGERVMLLDPNSIEWVGFAKSKVGKQVFVKSVPLGLTKDDVDPVSFTITGESVRPFAPGVLHYKRPPGDPDEFSLRWVYRDRRPKFDPTSEELVEQIEPQEVYKIEIYADAALTTLLLKKEVAWSEKKETHAVRKWTVTTAKQSAAGMTPGQECWVRVRQQGFSGKKAGSWSPTLHVQAKNAYRPATGGIATYESVEGTEV